MVENIGSTPIVPTNCLIAQRSERTAYTREMKVQILIRLQWYHSIAANAPLLQRGYQRFESF